MSRPARYTWMACVCALPFPIIGLAVGKSLAEASVAAHLAEQHSRGHLETGGLASAFVLLGGILMGALAGVVIGGLVAEMISCWGRFHRERLYLP